MTNGFFVTQQGLQSSTFTTRVNGIRSEKNCDQS
jgi:hypothetical protein